MPYRAMFSTIVTAAVALICIAMWLWYVAPLVAATTAVATTLPAASTAHAVSGESPELMLKRLVEGVMLLSFLLICLLLVVGFAATFREWVRYGSRPAAHPFGAKTQYVDAWKIAGERLKVEKNEGKDEEDL